CCWPFWPESSVPRIPRSSPPGWYPPRLCVMSEAEKEAPILLRADRLSKTYTDGQVRAVCAVSFTVRRGEYVAITGPSGCGKSTLLNLLGGLDTPDEGAVF